MKKMKKMLALMLACVMVLAIALPTMATEPDTYSITIEQNSADTGNHTYGAYKIFKGDLSDGVLSNLAWADGVTISDAVATEISTALGIPVADATDATKVAAALDGEEFNAEKAQKFADAIAPALTTAEKEASGIGDVTISGLTGGYYLVKDITNPTGQYASQTKFILKVTSPTNKVEVKSSVPSVEKKVEDKADTTSATGSYGDSADHDINDTFHYTLTATLGDGIQNFKKYYLKFKDTMSEGLTFVSVESVIVDYDGNLTTSNDQTTITGSKTLTQTETGTIKAADGETVLDAKVYELEIADLFAEEGVVKANLKNGSKVVVTYTATLNANAQIGQNGNPNDVSLIYGSNPNYEGTGTPDTEETPKDRNIVFTYKTVVNKVDPNGVALTGAAFKLEKKNSGGTWDTVEEFTVDAQSPASTFEFEGLDDGCYKLTETATPSSYNSIEPIYFVIEATHNTNSDNPDLTDLKVWLTDEDGEKLTEQKDGVAVNIAWGDISLSEGSVTTDIVNQKGAILPSTGGIGTTIFYIVGAGIIIVAGVLLVTRKRMAK